MKGLYFVAFVLLLQACGTVDYIPEEYAINNDRIDDFTVKGRVSVINVQTNTTEVKFYDGTTSWAGDYKTVTAHFKQQLSKEIIENTAVSLQGEVKSIRVKVVELHARQKAFHFISKMRVEYRLGNGHVGYVNVSQGSPGNMWRVLNGTIALGVIEMLKDDRVISYLSE